MPNLNVHVPEDVYKKLIEDKKELEKKIGGKITWDKYLELKLVVKDEEALKREAFIQIGDDIKRLVQLKINPTIVETLKDLHYYIIFNDNKNAISEAQKLIKLLES